MEAKLSYNVAPNFGENGTSIIPVGSIIQYATTTNTAPDGWLLCNGAQISRTQYGSLFRTIGTTFGAGDGSTTFNLPFTNGKTIRGSFQSAGYYIGQEGGSDGVMLGINNLAPHSHAIWQGGATALSSGSGVRCGDPNVDSGLAGGGALFLATDTPSTAGRTQAVAQDGTGQLPFSVINQYIAFYYIIKY